MKTIILSLIATLIFIVLLIASEHFFGLINTCIISFCLVSFLAMMFPVYAMIKNN